MRTNEIVPVSESKCAGPFDTVPGTITVGPSYISDPLPLCINNDAVSSWYATVYVTGGYAPYDGFVCFKQKGEFAGKVYLTWTPVEDPQLPCCTTEYMLTFSVTDPFCLDSNQYPVLVGDDVIAPDKQTTIPGKEVYMNFVSFWKGCHEPNQYFLIISAQQDLAFLSSSYPPNPIVRVSSA
jgi:hypothetical protein